VKGFWGSPVKFATLLFCEKFNGASRVLGSGFRVRRFRVQGSPVGSSGSTPVRSPGPTGRQGGGAGHALGS